MHTKTKTKLRIGLLLGILIMPLVWVGRTHAAALTSNISQFTLYEDPASGKNETRFFLSLIPEPIASVTTTFSTNGQCSIGHNYENYATGGAIVTPNDKLGIGVRAIDDTDGEGTHTCEVRFSAVSNGDSAYATPVVLDYSFKIIDNDIQLKHEFSTSTLTLSRLKEATSIIEQYELDISHAPQEDIYITASVGNQCDLLIGTPQRRSKTAEGVFRAGEEDTIKFSLIAVDDSVYEGIHQCSVQHSASTLDVDFKGVAVPTYSTSILDNETNPDIPDQREYEGGLIYYKDANYDGVDDDKQPQVVSFMNQVRKKRQGLVLLDRRGELSESCRFVSAVTSTEANEESSSLQSTHGVINVSVACEGERDYTLMWLLDAYDEYAKDWNIYDVAGDSTLNRIPHSAGIYNLGEQFTTMVTIDLSAGGEIALLQAQPAVGDIELTEQQALVADVNNSRLNPIATLSAASALMTVLWLVYRRYFGGVQTVKSRYPRVDHF